MTTELVSRDQKTKIAELANEFFRGRKPTTLKAYQQDLCNFKVFLGVDTERAAVEMLVKEDAGTANSIVLGYKAYLVDSGFSAATVNRRLSTIKSLVKFARLTGHCSFKIEVRGLKSEAYRDTAGPGVAAYRDILGQAEGQDSKKAIRDTAIVRLLHDLALRRGEVVALDIEDIDLNTGRVAVLGKGRHEKRKMSMPEPTRKALEGWIYVRGLEPGALFTNVDRAGKGSGRLTGTAIYQIVRKLGATVGVTTRPHALRHQAITEVIGAAQRAGVPLPEVLDFSRHASLDTLQIYCDRAADRQGMLSSLIA